MTAAVAPPGWTAAARAGQSSPGRDPDESRLVEHEPEIREERPTERDLAGRPGDRLALVDQPRRQPADQDLVRGQAVAAGDRDRDELEGECPAGPDRGLRRDAEGKVRAHDERPGPDDDDTPARASSDLAEGIVGEGAIGRHAPVDDLPEGIRAGDVDPLEAGDDRALRATRGAARHIPIRT